MNQALAQYGITREQAQAFLATNAHYNSPLYRAPHVACGSGADLIHRIGPLVGKSKLQQARVHAGRAVERALDLVREDLPVVAQSARKIAPHLPAVARWAVSEGIDMLPGLTNSWQQTVRGWLTPNDRQQGEIVRAQELDVAKLDSARAKSKRAESGATRLQVVA
jgi:hypothetical protein